MKLMRLALLASLLVFTGSADSTADGPAKKTSLEALQAFHDLIGSWKATGQPEGTRAEKQKGFWTESVRWRWHFKGDEASLKVAFEKGKYFTKGDLHYLPERDRFQFSAVTTGEETLTYEGSL